MFIDPDAGLTFEQILANLWKRKPELHQRALACAELAGQTLEEFARQADEELAARLDGDVSARERYFNRREWEVCPFGIDPTRKGPPPW